METAPLHEAPKPAEGREASADGRDTAPPEDASASGPSWPDEAAESAMVSELRDRGEFTPTSPSAHAEAAEETETAVLPPLNDLVEKIPAEVRDVLEELFRARFVTVKRVPKKALK